MQQHRDQSQHKTNPSHIAAFGRFFFFVFDFCSSVDLFFTNTETHRSTEPTPHASPRLRFGTWQVFHYHFSFVFAIFAPPRTLFFFRPKSRVRQTSIHTETRSIQPSAVRNPARPRGRSTAVRVRGVWALPVFITRTLCRRPSAQVRWPAASRPDAPRLHLALASLSWTHVICPSSTIHFSFEISAINAWLCETVMTAPRKFLSACVSAASVSLSR